MRLSSLTLAVAVVLLAAGGTVRAHHSYAEYEDRSASIQGTIEGIEFANPHVILTIQTTDAGVYTATWNAAAQLMRQGVSADLLKIGDRVVVTGSPSKVRPDLSKIRKVQRLSDDWAWISPTGNTALAR